MSVAGEGDHSAVRSVLESRATHLNLIAALLATFIGLLALAVSVYAVYWQRQAVRAQVWPVVEMGHSNTHGFAFNLENSGVGPAAIRSVLVTVDGTPVANWNEVIKKLVGPRSLDVIISTLHERTIRAGAEIEIFQVGDAAAAKAIESQVSRVSIELCYCSVLGDCWTTEEGRDVAGPCKPNPRPFEQ